MKLHISEVLVYCNKDAIFATDKRFSGNPNTPTDIWENILGKNYVSLKEYFAYQKDHEDIGITHRELQAMKTRLVSNVIRQQLHFSDQVVIPDKSELYTFIGKGEFAIKEDKAVEWVQQMAAQFGEWHEIKPADEFLPEDDPEFQEMQKLRAIIPHIQ